MVKVFKNDREMIRYIKEEGLPKNKKPIDFDDMDKKEKSKEKSKPKNKEKEKAKDNG